MKHATGPYQTFDPLAPDEFAALERDILKRGVQVAIELDEDGNILDGHHRKTICDKHGITDYPTVVRRGLSEQEKRTHARSLNMARRQLTREQKQRQIEMALTENPTNSDRRIASMLNVDHKTVGAHRRRLEAGGEIPHAATKVGVNGMPYTPPETVVRDATGQEVPAKLHKIFATVSALRRLQNRLAETKREIVALGKTSAPLKGQVPKCRALVDQLHMLLERSVPHAVHPDCAGGGCDSCEGLGYIAGGETPHLPDD